jgi:hypothetical protein
MSTPIFRQLNFWLLILFAVSGSLFFFRSQGAIPSIPGIGSARRVDSLPSKDSIQLETSALDLGDIESGVPIEKGIDFRNISEHPIGVSSIKTGCSCVGVTPLLDGDVAAPGKPGRLLVRITPKPGTERWPVEITLTNGQQFEFVLHGTIYEKVRVSPTAVDFGAIQVGEKKSSAVSVAGEEGEWTTGEVVATDPWLACRIERVGNSPDSTSPNTNRRGRKMATFGLIHVQPHSDREGSFHSMISFNVAHDGREETLRIPVSWSVMKPVFCVPERLTFTTTSRKQKVILRSLVATAQVDELASDCIEMVGITPPFEITNARVIELKLKDAASPGEEGKCVFKLSSAPIDSLEVPFVFRD